VETHDSLPEKPTMSVHTGTSMLGLPCLTLPVVLGGNSVNCAIPGQLALGCTMGFVLGNDGSEKTHFTQYGIVFGVLYYDSRLSRLRSTDFRWWKTGS